MSITTLKQVDIEVYKDRDATRKFIVTVDSAPVDISDGTINLLYVAEDGDPTEKTVLGTVGGTNSNEVTFILPKADLGVIGLYEYKVIQTPSAGDDIPWFFGNISIIDETGITASLPIYIQDEKPANLSLDQDKINNRVRYWRNYLQPLVNPVIADEDLDDESKWPFLVNVLIAKLVVYDGILLELKNAAVTAAGSSSDSTVTGSGAVKKIETGPSNVEWYDSAEAVSSLLKTGTNGTSTMDGMLGDLCMLASRVRITLPICPKPNRGTVIPIKAVMDPLEGNSVTDILNRNNIADIPSQS